MDTTTTTTTKGATPMTHREYVERVNEAAGTDIEILESNWRAYLEGEEFAEAGRLQGIIYAARAAAGLDPVTGR
jgi:hypothetical protein